MMFDAMALLDDQILSLKAMAQRLRNQPIDVRKDCDAVLLTHPEVPSRHRNPDTKVLKLDTPAEIKKPASEGAGRL